MLYLVNQVLVKPRRQNLFFNTCVPSPAMYQHGCNSKFSRRTPFLRHLVSVKKQYQLSQWEVSFHRQEKLYLKGRQNMEEMLKVGVPVEEIDLVLSPNLII